MAYEEKHSYSLLHHKGRMSLVKPLIFVWVILTGIGILNLYSATLGQQLFYNQLGHLGLALTAFFVIAYIIPVHFFNNNAYIFYIVTCLALLLVLVTGDSAGGSQRWLNFAGLRWQPSEIAKLAVAIVVARFIYKNSHSRGYTLRELFPLMLLVAGLFGLIYLQPDLGTAGLCLMIAVGQVIFLRLDWKSLAIAASLGIASLISVWSFGLRPYQKMRILTLLNPTSDPMGSGYNALQSLITIGSGGTFGKGYLMGTQTHLKFLPARHTDFIFSVFAEEFGFFFGVTLFALFFAFFYLTLEVSRHAKNNFSRFLALGIAALFFFEFTINIAMVLGLFPVVGMPLPFFSYGGSSMLILTIATAILISIERESLGYKSLITLIR